MSDPRTRTLEALETVARHYGVTDDLRRLQQANVWQPEAVAMLAEVVAALVLEVKPGTVRRRYGAQRSG